MFRIFRKARSDALNDKSTYRFVRYAIGEILLVVVGILIALQINNWNEDRLDRLQEREYLNSMLNDLQVDADRIEDAVSGNAILLDGLDRLLGMLADPSQDPMHQRQVFMHALVYTYWYLRVDFSELTMSQMKSSGNLLLIRDKEVRDAMLTYEQGLEACKHQYMEMTHYFHVIEETQKRLFNPVLSKKSFEFIEENFLNILESLETYEPLVPHGQYLNNDDPSLWAQYYGDVLFYRTALNNTSAFLSEQKRLAGSLAELIRKKYRMKGGRGSE
jgi:hypothetical protein